MTTLPEANAKFAVDLFKVLATEHQCDNLVFSPVNLTAGLGLLAYASGCEQADQIEKVLHWDEVKECDKPRSRSLGHSTTRLRRAQEKVETCPRPRPRPEPTKPEATCPRPRPRPEPTKPEPTCPRPRPRPEPTRPEPTCPKPRPRPEPEQPKPCDKRRVIHRPAPCPEPEPEPRCPRRDVPCYECEEPEGIHTAFSKILATLNEPSSNYTLSFANKLYGNKDIAFIQKFLYCALKLYLTEVENADLHNAPEEVRRLINLWVEVQTHGKIKDLLPKDSFDCLAQLLLVNALYFKGQWEVKFDKELTEEAPFYPHHADEKECHSVQLMHRKGVYNAGTIDLCNVQVQVVEIPYKNNELTFVLLLPVDCNAEALEQLEDGLSHEHLLDLSCHLKAIEVDLAIPKFSSEKSIEANEYLNLLDLTDHEKADFSGATTTEGVALTQLVHDAAIEIDEEGGEEPEPVPCPKDRRPRREPVEIWADHPFLYYIVHNSTQSIIALGRFAKPE
uniref:Serpin B3-like n=1 Tax=Podarcis muralis TaxID=64176 RepID=A0A670IAP9_PODMU|nr:serpin B3-like [Podarcis muralis]